MVTKFLDYTKPDGGTFISVQIVNKGVYISTEESFNDGASCHLSKKDLSDFIGILLHLQSKLNR